MVCVGLSYAVAFSCIKFFFGAIVENISSAAAGFDSSSSSFDKTFEISILHIRIIIIIVAIIAVSAYIDLPIHYYPQSSVPSV